MNLLSRQDIFYKDDDDDDDSILMFRQVERIPVVDCGAFAGRCTI